MFLHQVPTISGARRRVFQIITPPTALAILVLVSCFLLGSAGLAQTVTDLHSFTSSGNSQYPYLVTPAQGRDGELFGTTTGLNYGSIFRLRTTGVGSDLFAFDDTDGYGPTGGVTLGTDGNLYGTTQDGGTAGYGVLFKIGPGGTYTVLHEFSGGSDGLHPNAAPIEGFDGNFYGTTEGAPDFLGATVYKYTPSGSFTTYQLDNGAFYGILASLIQGSNGNLYGTAYYGANNCGSIFELTTSGTLLMEYDFDCGKVGSNPSAPLVQASDGNFFGTTYTGTGDRGGTVFRMTPQGAVALLHTFATSGGGGKYPVGGLVQGTDGNLYGSTRNGGSEGNGVLYQITTSGAYTELYSFSARVGESPTGSLVQHTDGLFYGTAYLGGAFGYGSVYSLDMGLGPFITFVRPTGKVGQAAQILGQGLTGTTGVTFNGVPSTSLKVVSDTFLTATVPSGATTGAVVVTTPGGTLTSNKNFRVVAGP